MRENLFLGLGGNLGDVRENFRVSIRGFVANPHFEIHKISAAYRTAALTVAGIDSAKPNYWNIVLMLSSDLEVNELLGFCQTLETQSGRIRTDERWISRTLDIDILAWDSVRHESERLTIPHARCLERCFVLAPWAELCEDFVVPTKSDSATSVGEAWKLLRNSVEPQASILEVDESWLDKRTFGEACSRF